ncbi:MAG: hypothetical protein AB7O78_19930 [Thermoleophilia bacterium]
MTATRNIAVAAALLVAAAALPATAGAATSRTSFQLTQITPSRVWAETSWFPFGLDDPPGAIHRYRLGAWTFVGPWIPASVSTLSATDGLATLRRDARYGSGGQAVLADRVLTRAESRRFTVLAEVYRDADVLVVAAGHPACAGLTRGQARSIASGRVTRWSQVVAGAPVDPIRVVHLIDSAGAPVPHLGTRWVGAGVRWRVTYAPGAAGAADGGVGRAAGGDQGVAAITTWSRIRARTAGICAVPLGGVAPADDTVASLAFPEAFPVRLVVTRAVPGRSAEARAHVRVLRRETRTYLRSPGFRALLAQRGLAPAA